MANFNTSNVSNISDAATKLNASDINQLFIRERDVTFWMVAKQHKLFTTAVLTLIFLLATIEHYFKLAGLLGVYVFYLFDSKSEFLKKEYAKHPGKLAEYELHTYLSEELDHRDFTVFHDVRLKVGDSFAQIDHIIVSKRGIFIVETKDWKGLVIPKKRVWTVYSEVGARPVDRPSPVDQVELQKAKLSNYLDVSPVKILPLVYLNNNTEEIGRSKMLFGDYSLMFRDETTYWKNLVFKSPLALIVYIQSFNAEVLTDVSVNEICSKLQPICHNFSRIRKKQ